MRKCKKNDGQMLNFGGQKLKGGGQNLNPKMQKMKGREIGEIPKKNWVLSLVLRLICDQFLKNRPLRPLYAIIP